ncbi:YfhD family protein [Fictibacillus phosphorivorans]|uniref:YfhD family protein n=1 Tax=Fictibacillus phosphorivorans TaxID=1221500 RepID=UPI00203AC7E0|nr:YfhD family protein [Fictibacillus phosphorivorans]MCM3718180.1 YfhD family protein [Fictibacillus phosphorivorans]MCM3775807.1 YfhD family protein [Fictibacillus phosphorivorans]
MRHQRHKGNKDKNLTSMPQVPKNQIADSNSEEYEFAKELNAEYEFEQKPGFDTTGVRRKDEDEE